MNIKSMSNSLNRKDLSLISDLIPHNSKILDLGCGDGSLLRILRANRNVFGCGVEFSQDKILDCVSAGVPVLHADLNEGLRDFPDKSFDYVVLSQTLQAIKRPDMLLAEMMRVGNKGIVGFINFGYISVRLQLLFHGKMPLTETLPSRWYETANIHLSTIRDFRDLCAEKNISIAKEIPADADSNFLSGYFPNLFARTCVFVLE